MIYRLGSCWIAVDDIARHLVTRLPDRSEVYAAANHDPVSRKLAAELGYTSTWAMSRDHELAHTWLALQDGDRCSRTLWYVAHHKDLCWNFIRREETRVLEFQRALDKGRHRPWDWAGTLG